MRAPTLALLALACKPPDATAPSVVYDVPVTEARDVAGLRCDVEILRTPGNVPHVFARDDADAAFAVGFAYARDRFFFLDVARRLALGQLSALLGDLALDVDVGSRNDGMTQVADALAASMDPADARSLDAYAAGVNAWMDEVRAGRLPPPAELELAAPLLGAADPADLLTPYTRRDVAGALTAIVYQLSFDADDLLRSEAQAAVAAGLWPEGTPLLAERTAMALALARRVQPLVAVTSAPGFAGTPPGARRAASASAPQALLRRAAAAQRRQLAALGAAPGEPRGSNAWAVAGARTTDGATLLAGDGHLPLTVPSLFWQLGVDTAELGGGDLHQVGLGLPGLPFIGVGSNGDVAWSLTRLYSDTTDWYVERLTLDDGLPAASQTPTGPAQLRPIDEVVAVSAALGSVARDVRYTRYATADGRLLVDVEGDLLADDAPGPAVHTGAGRVAPRDVDGDGEVTAISFDWVGLDPIGLVTAFRRFGAAQDLDDFEHATGWLNGYAQNTVAADRHGEVLYTAYGALPCRDDRRAPGGGWAPGGDPQALVDGAVFGGFTIPTDATARVLDGGEGTTCALPAARQPRRRSPPEGYVANANEDPGGYAFDDALDDATYVGGPWDVGLRAGRIHAALAAGPHDLGTTAALQGDHVVPAALHLASAAVVAVDAVLAADPDDGAEAARLAALAADPRLPGARDLLQRWVDRGAWAPSGVDTPYHDAAEDDLQDSGAASLYHAWVGRFAAAVLADEPLPEAIWQGSRSDGTTAVLVDMTSDAVDTLPGRLPVVTADVFADDLSTPDVVEGWPELAVAALSAALDALEAPPDGPDAGGFGSADPTAWRWGARHLVGFDSAVGAFLGDNPLLASLLSRFAIGPDALGIGGELGELPGFPRPGGDDSVDAAGAGYQTSTWRYTSGPSFRMAFALHDDHLEAYNVLPGGQSARPGDPHFADQALLWLANEALPVQLAPADVAAAATGRERLRGGGCE